MYIETWYIKMTSIGNRIAHCSCIYQQPAIFCPFLWRRNIRRKEKLTQDDDKQAFKLSFYNSRKLIPPRWDIRDGSAALVSGSRCGNDSVHLSCPPWQQPGVKSGKVWPSNGDLIWWCFSMSPLGIHFLSCFGVLNIEKMCFCLFSNP